MPGSTEVLQEYLVSLGFHTDAVSFKKMEDYVGGMGKKLFAVGGMATGLILSLEAATAAFSYNMRKMYFESELSGSTVKNMKAMSYGAEQIGISGESMQSAIHGMAQSLRLNPGLQAMVESLGVKVTGRDMSDVAIDLVSALRKMPEYVGAQYAQMFGFDPDTYHQMITHLDTLNRKRREMQSIYRAAGVDPDAAKGTILEYTAALDKLEAKIEVLGQKLMIALGPTFTKLTSLLDKAVDLTTTFIGQTPQEMTEQKYGLAKGTISDLGLENASDEEIEKAAKRVSQLMKKYGVSTEIAVAKYKVEKQQQFEKETEATPERMEQLRALETQYHLPKGMLTASLDANKSGGGVTYQQHTEINVHGNDATTTARMVAGSQDRVNQDALRNLKGTLK